MNGISLILGMVLVVAAVIDLLWTTLWVEGGTGPIAKGLTTLIWQSAKRIAGHRHTFLSVIGPVILMMTLSTWVLMLWLGWTFVFASSPASLINTTSANPIGWWDFLYFAGYNLFTMGNGDFSPNGPVWQVLSAITSGSGMLLLTFGASYIISVVGAVVQKRSFASNITAMGSNPIEVVKTSWNGKDFHDLNQPFSDLIIQLGELTEQHKAYPLLHYYHTSKETHAMVVAVALIAETLFILEEGTVPGGQPNKILMKQLNASIAHFITTVGELSNTETDKTPPLPQLEKLEGTGIPIIPTAAFLEKATAKKENRKKLLATVHADSWEWPY